jgi:hypothetical protein
VADEYKPDLPEGMALPKGASINTEHPDFKALTAVARAEGWSQSSFSKVLGLEVSRSERARVTNVTPAPAPAPASGVPANWGSMTASQRFAHSLGNSPGRK